MAEVLLIYPFFRSRRDRSVFRFPPLGVGYVAAYLRQQGHRVAILDCTFLSRREAMRRAKARRAEVVGIYGMVTMKDDCLRMARALAAQTKLLVAGGPLPTTDPQSFLPPFDVVVHGEGEQTMAELIVAYESGAALETVPGLTLPEATTPGKVRRTALRPLAPELDRLPFPARDLLPNDAYIRYTRARYGHAITSIMTTRGCPFACEFCSNEVFGVSYRARSIANVLDEVEEVLALGFERVHFADDVLTLYAERTLELCCEIERRGLRFRWECLARADSLDLERARAMRAAGCAKVYFGIESGSDAVLARMNKRLTAASARRGVEAAHAAGLQTGAFFILFYPGDTEETVLTTIRFALSLPLDYLSFTLPYPLPGTALYQRLQGRHRRAWRQPAGVLSRHERIFAGDFSAAKMRFGVLKGTLEFIAKKQLGAWAARAVQRPTDVVLRWLP
ncbi:MAG: B12-binding domain-containing radical SAM protein [Deltaproteobacteria bacterium]|nr:B12-binding domain-containing radical SAM protein [Deltaproteobacteria bacterium]